MQYSIVAVLALAGSVLANPAPAQVTITTSTTQLVTITTCAPTITDCPAARYPVTVTQTIPVTYSYPAVTSTASNGLQPTPGCPAGAACGYATGNGYKFPNPTTTGYKGPVYSGAADSKKVAGALAGVGAVAALLL